MMRGIGFTICLELACVATALAQGELLTKIEGLELQGQFTQATAILTTALQSKTMTEPERKSLEFELDRLSRIRKDFPYTREQLYAELKKFVTNLTPNEFDQWVDQGRFDSREIEGRREEGGKVAAREVGS